MYKKLYCKHKMKKYLIVILIMFSVLIFNAYNVSNVYAGSDKTNMTTSSRKVTVKVLKATKKQIKIKIKNNGKKDFYFSELFVLKKQGKNKWKKVKFSEKAVFCKTIVARSGKSITVKLKWKKLFGKNLSRGKYKIKLVKTKSFKIK